MGDYGRETTWIDKGLKYRYIIMQVKELIKYRRIWMILAMFWIILFHSGITINSAIFDYIRTIGYGGVDVFLFASGVGCYHSFQNNPNALNFIKRRMNKILPTFYLFLVVWLIYNHVSDIPTVIGNFFCVQSFTGGLEVNWYMTAMWIMYFLTPYLYGVIQYIHSKYQFVLICLILLIFTIPFWGNVHLIISITRIPIYFIGMYVASREEQKITGKKLCVLFGMFLGGMFALRYCYQYHSDLLWTYGLHWYPFILSTPFMCFACSWACGHLDRIKIGKTIVSGLDFLGKYTFELFLVHIFVFQIRLDLWNKGLIHAGIMLHIGTIIGIVLGVMFLNLSVKGLKTLVHNCFLRRKAGLQEGNNT